MRNKKAQRWDTTEILINVVDCGGFSAAAKQLGLSKSHVSRQVADLENRLGVQLLNRTTRRLSLTETGRAYYNRCKDLLSQLEEAEQSVMDLQNTPRGCLRMTLAGAFGERYIAPLAAEFMRMHPNLEVHMDFSNRNVDLLAEGFDLAVRAGPLIDSSLIARRIANRRLVICASPDYLKRYGVPENINSLKKHNCLVGSVPTWRFREENGHHSDRKIEGTWHSNNGHALLAAVKAGIGLTQLPLFYVHEELESGQLISVLENYQASDTAVWAVYPSNRHLSPKVRAFVDFLASELLTFQHLL